LRFVGVVTTLTKLSLEGCFNITDNGLDHLTQLKNLRALNLSRCSGLSDAGISKICDLLTQIQDLNLSELSTLTESGLATLSRNKNLRVLSLSHCKFVDDYAIRALTRRLKTKIPPGGLVSLQHLSLVNCPISDSIVQELLLFPSIKTLDLFGTKVSSKGIQLLVDKLKHMEVRMGQYLVSKELDVNATPNEKERKMEDVWGRFNFRGLVECGGFLQIYPSNNKQDQNSDTDRQEKTGTKRSYNKIS